MNTINEPDALNILSLEDSIFDFEIISEKLMGVGYSVNITRVETGADFTSFIQSNRYDIILADYNLPHFDAFRALEIRNQYGPDIPFICVSGSIGEILAIELLKKGADDYVLKDRLERLPFAIKRALADSEERNKRKEAEEALRKSEERLRDILFSTADWVWEIGENLEFTYTSQSGLNLLKLTEEEVIGKTPVDFMLPDEAERVSAVLQDLISTKRPIKDLENWLVGKDGSMVCLLTNGVPIINDEGQFRGFRGVGKDITERKLSENAIRQSEAELNFAQEIGNMGSWHHHLATNKYKHSHNLARILGMDPEVEDGFQFFLNHIHPDDSHLVDQYVTEITDTRNEVSYELRYVLDNGDIKWFQNIIKPTFKERNLTDLHGVMIDITENKRIELDLIKAKEKAEASDKLKTSFINNISHEIRTPLNGILGFTEVLTDPDLPTEEKETYLAMLYSSSERLINTVTNFLDISLLTSGNQMVYKKEIELKSLIEQTIEKFKAACLTKKLIFSLEIPEGEQDIRIITDKDILEKILYQLMDNAIKFTPTGSITLGYKTNDDEMLFFVRDTGIGIQPENQKQIFENFMQENTATTRGYEGSGLGLAIAKGFVDLLGGRIWLDSQKGQGTTFFFYIPLEQKISSPRPGSSPGEPFIPSRHRQTILVAEDDETNFFYINLLLKDAFIDILHAWNGIQAVELCRDHPEVELVLMDLKMPEMDGFEATMHIKAMRPDLPVIAVSAYMSSEDKHKAALAGCDEFITKPIRKELLLKKVQENGRLIF